MKVAGKNLGQLDFELVQVTGKLTPGSETEAWMKEDIVI
jgi:hypothetical protein